MSWKFVLIIVLTVPQERVGFGLFFFFFFPAERLAPKVILLGNYYFSIGKFRFFSIGKISVAPTGGWGSVPGIPAAPRGGPGCPVVLRGGFVPHPSSSPPKHAAPTTVTFPTTRTLTPLPLSKGLVSLSISIGEWAQGCTP